MIVEVTLTVGARQYEAEGAPVFRHVGKYQKENPNKTVFGLFVADKLDVNMPIEFLSRAQVNTNLYDGKVKILPMDRLRFSDLFSNKNFLKQCSAVQFSADKCSPEQHPTL